MTQLLKPDDRFVDIGANIGMLTLKGASLVGKLGRVDSFEPNPNCCKRIRENLELNKINNVYLHEVGLSDKTDTLKLSIITDFSPNNQTELVLNCTNFLNKLFLEIIRNCRLDYTTILNNAVLSIMENRYLV